ncbi:MAG: hypothetical protein ACLP4V_06520 [Methylocella sp.]
MKPSTPSILSIPLLVAGAIALSGCGQSSKTPTTMTYHQIGICKSYETSATQTAKPDEGFGVFKIDSVDNSQNGSVFYFDPVRFYVNQSKPEDKGNIYRQDRRFMIPDARIGPALGIKYVDKITIGKGEKVDDVGYILIPLVLTNPTQGPEANKLNFDVTFDTGTGDRGTFDSVAEGIKIVKTNPPDTKYTVIENCKELPFK